jgi:hypothetical protein
MDGLQLRDEAVRDRVRAAQEFLDPSSSTFSRDVENANRSQVILRREATDQTSY